MDSQAIAQTAATPSIGYRTKPALRSRQAQWRAWAGIVGLALVVKLLIVLAALVASGRTADPATTVLLQWRQWDASHYLYLAGHGYATTGDLRNLIAFFPLYPATIALLGLAGVPLAVGALIISNVSSVVAAVLLYEIARLESDDAAAFRAAALFVMFPTAYFLFNGYSEGLFCTLAFGSVLAARYGRWLPAGGLGALAAATRVTGIALLPFLLVEMAALPLTRSQRQRALAGAALVPLGLLSYLAVNWWVLHDPLAFVDVQRRHWFHWLSSPWTGAVEATRWFANRDPWLRLTVGAGELVGAAVAYTVSLLSWMRLRPSDATYALVVTVLVTFLPFWLSIPRYLLALYPLFVLAGRVRLAVVQGVVAVASLSALVVLSVAFTRGLWAF